MRTVGVVMATYNGENFLDEQLNSIVKQIQRPQQVVIVDDCSQDDTIAIILKYIKEFPDLILLIKNTENLGPKRAFEIGISKCTTDYIALCDQDDIWEPEKIANQFKSSESNKHAKLCFHDLKLVNSKGNHIAKSYWKLALEPLPVTGSQARERLVDCLNPVPGCTMFFSSDLKQHIIPMPASRWICHDWWICVVAFFFGNPISINDTLTKYRLHPNQTAGIRVDLKKEREKVSAKKLISRIKREIIRLFNKNSSRKIRLIGLNKIKYVKSKELLKLIEQWKDINESQSNSSEYKFLKSKIEKNIETSYAFLEQHNEV